MLALTTYKDKTEFPKDSSERKMGITVLQVNLRCYKRSTIAAYMYISVASN